VAQCAYVVMAKIEAACGEISHQAIA
jgi:hypothetical protein